MIGIVATRILTCVGSVNDTEIRRIAAAGILNAAATDADRTAFADLPEIIGILCAAIGIVGHRINTFDGSDRGFCTDIHKTGCADIYTDAFFTGLRCRILSRMFGTIIVTCTAVHDIIRMKIQAGC